jgi:hypothetical protein
MSRMWCDKFQLFQFSFSSVAYSRLSTVMEVRSQKADGQTTQAAQNSEPTGAISNDHGTIYNQRLTNCIASK